MNKEIKIVSVKYDRYGKQITKLPADLQQLANRMLAALKERLGISDDGLTVYYTYEVVTKITFYNNLNIKDGDLLLNITKYKVSSWFYKDAVACGIL
jgi:hypothetical protein